MLYVLLQVPGENSLSSGQGKVFAVTFQAPESIGLLHFWSGIGECVDIESVSIIQGEGTATSITTTTSAPVTGQWTDCNGATHTYASIGCWKVNGHSERVWKSATENKRNLEAASPLEYVQKCAEQAKEVSA